MMTEIDETTPLLTKNENNVQETGQIERSDSYGSSQISDLDESLDNYRFSFRRLLQFVGPGFLVSIAYLDPGNIEADLQAGTAVQYKLLWVLLWSTILGLLTQRMASRIGVVTGFQMSELCYKIYPKFPRILLWIMMEIAIIGSDIQEVIGTAIAFVIISSKKIPIYGGVLITLADTLTFLLLENYGLRRLELFFAFLIVVMAGTFGYEYGISNPDQAGVIKGIFYPNCVGCDVYTAWIQGIGILGSCIMPHNLYLHSSLVTSRVINRDSKGKIKEANFYNLLETGFSLFVSFIINLFVISVFAKGLYNVKNSEVYKLCEDRHVDSENLFPNNSTLVDEMNIYKGGVYLHCAFGAAALYIWAVGILAAGQSSTMTGTYSGQVIMEGFLNLRWKRWKRVLFTRCMAIMPTLFLAIYGRIDDLSGLNDYMNVLMTIQLPFALIPALTLTNSKFIMGDFVNGRINKIGLGLLSLLIIAVNFFSFWESISKNFPHFWWVWLLFSILLCVYASFVIYLLMFQFAMEGYNNIITRLVLSSSELWLAIRNGEKLPSKVINEENDEPDKI